jgi:sugar phosphate isomerase/epimerase
MKMGNMYAVELFSVRDELQKDLWGTLRKVKKMGYDGVEFFGGYTRTAQELSAALDDTGLICCGWHTPIDCVRPESLAATITYNKVLGNTDIVIPWLAPEMFETKDAMLKTAEKLNEIEDKVSEYGMRFGYHNHAQEFKVTADGTLPYYYLYDNMPRVGLQFDNGNALGAGPHVDQYEILERWPGKAKTLHIKPYSAKKGYATMIGEDDVDWQRFFNAAYENHEVEWFIVEYECTELYSQLEGVERCIKALKKLEAEGKI